MWILKSIVMDRQSRIIRYIFLLLLVSFIGAGAGAAEADELEDALVLPGGRKCSKIKFCAPHW